MKVIKRDGREVRFDAEKIRQAISAANVDVSDVDRLYPEELERIVREVESDCADKNRAVSVEEIQDIVITELASSGHIKLMLHYCEYRYRHEMLRKRNTTDAKVLSLLRHENELAKQENANKDTLLNSTLRDYLASEVSEDICRRYKFPEEVIKAHDDGMLHIHKQNCGLAA